MTTSRAASPPSPTSTTSTSSPRRLSRHNSQNLSLDLSDLPPLITPSPPTNTLLITNLLDPSIFHPASLATIRSSISQLAPLHSFSPLKSFRRIIVSFYTTDSALAVRQALDGESILSHRIKIFFGAPTPVEAVNQHLAAPDAGKLFFISPPPSPPVGWEMRNEEPPNKEVHAEDLAEALGRLKTKANTQWKGADPMQGMDVDVVEPSRISPITPTTEDGRARSGSMTVVYHPDHHGDSPALPAVMVEDTTGSEEFGGAVDGTEEKRIMAHTARPPTELMSR